MVLLYFILAFIQLPVGTLYDIIAGIRIPPNAFTNCFPLRHRSLKLDARKSQAIPERLLTNTRHAIRYRNTFKRTAIIERIIPDTRHTVSNRDIFK